MGIRLIHTSDWQIGKVFRFLDGATMGVLQEARLAAITRIGAHAQAFGAGHVLVAGDVYDMQALSARSLNQPLERMRAFPTVTWHLIPANHDPHRPNGLWDQLVRRGLPANVQAHLARAPVALEAGAALLPAPLFHRHTLDDPTAWMDGAETADGVLRIGLAHGSVTGFGPEGVDQPNYISPLRPQTAGLAYLALGDWHRQQRIGPRCWYSGTPEPDAFDVEEGKALAVEIDGPDAPPRVEPFDTGGFRWVSLSAQLNARADIDHLAARLRALGADLDRVLVHLEVEGALSLKDRSAFEAEIVDGVSAALCVLRVDQRRLFPSPTAEDLDRIDRGGFVRAAAEELRRLGAAGGAEGALAAEALQRLYVEHMKLEAGRR